MFMIFKYVSYIALKMKSGQSHPGLTAHELLNSVQFRYFIWKTFPIMFSMQSKLNRGTTLRTEPGERYIETGRYTEGCNIE